MILYLLPIFALWIGDASNVNRKYIYLYILLLMLFICFGYMCGSDWRSYETIYSEIEIDVMPYFLLYYEPGFLLYTFLFKIIGFGFWEFHILTKIVIFVIFVYHLFKLQIKSKDIYMSLALFLSTAGYFFFIDCPFRNLIALGIALFSVKYLFERKFLPFFFIILVASLFHTTILIFIPIYWICNLRFSTKFYFLFFIFIFTICSSRDILFRLMEPISQFNPILSARFDSYSEVSDVSSASGFSLGMLIQLTYLFLFLRQHNNFITTVSHGNILFNLTFLYFVFYRVALVVPVLSRIQFDLNIFYIVSIPFLINNFTDQSKVLFKNFVFIISCVFIIVSVTSTTKYLPYTNYLYYKIMQRDLSFEERSEYNFQNSPYNK